MGDNDKNVRYIDATIEVTSWIDYVEEENKWRWSLGGLNSGENGDYFDTLEDCAEDARLYLENIYGASSVSEVKKLV